MGFTGSETVMIFEYEKDFEEALIAGLKNNGWDDKDGVLENPTEEDLINNWARILYENNNIPDRLNNCPLTQSEMRQLIEKIVELRTPSKLNGFINGRTVTITRDNQDDTQHYGKEIALKIYDRREIAAGQSRYQIAQQPQFTTKSPILNNRRGDVMLLINGMPVIHVELKRSGVGVSEAIFQINKYLHEGVFTGLFSLVQIFVAMSPEETVYFASPGNDKEINEKFCFHWADFNNEPINDWKRITSSLLSIPMAHQLIGFYTVADDSDGVLKVMRSYQYYAANAISDKVTKTKWGESSNRGGYIWHTTGSGKTMTSFKSAQLIANSKDADKVVFLMDRVELGTQSLEEYRSFAEESDSVQATENTSQLIEKLKSTAPSNTLIVTSIQKMSRIHDEDGGINSADLDKMRNKRIVFIIDECHRSTFGEMLATIKNTFQNALFFGFTGTPIHDENQKKMNTTTSVFGDELHRYSIADGIRDKNVLGFDPYMVCTFKQNDIRKEVALSKAKAKEESDVYEDPQKEKVFYFFMDTSKVEMAGHRTSSGKYEKGIEDFVPTVQYESEEHRLQVIADIKEHWMQLSRGGKFHAILATSSIPEAIEYYRLFKKELPNIKATALFDPNIDNNGGAIYKEDGLKEIIKDYNRMFDQSFTIPTHAAMKKDISARLAHKSPYMGIDKKSGKQIDILIVVDQMLTGFDSKWINTLYLDKVIEYELLIQAFSRTNRLFYGDEKQFGTIRYYRRPYTMKRNVEEAVKLYSGDKPFGLFVDKLPQNVNAMNQLFDDVCEYFRKDGVVDFAQLPESATTRAKFAQSFNKLHEHLEAAKVQGFTWDQPKCEGEPDPETGTVELVELKFNEQDFLTLALRYKELAKEKPFGDDPDEDPVPEAPYDLKGYLVQIDTGHIDEAYMNENFTKWLKALNQDEIDPEELDRLNSELHKSFALLTQDDQRCAEVFLHDIESGNIKVTEGRTLRDYINQYAKKEKDNQVAKLVEALGVNEGQLRKLLALEITETNINEFGRFDDLKETIDKAKARSYFEEKEGVRVSPPKVNIKADKLLREFLMQGGIDI